MRILPQHEQKYPDHVMPTRLQEYVFDDGRPPTQNRAYAVRVTGQQTYNMVVTAQKELGINDIDPRYFVGTCFHEAGCSNEVDTERASPTCIPGFVSVGAYQIGEEEANRFKYKLEDMLDFEKATKCMIQLASANLATLRKYILQLHVKPDLEDYTDPKDVLWVQGGIRAYLAIGHNKGMGYVHTTLSNYGLDWPGYKKRNPVDNIVAHDYGEDVVTGGPYFPGQPVVQPPGHRILQLTQPYTTGEDVKELQRHLNLKDDGAFGPLTEAALKLFQRGKGLPASGICDPSTWAALLATP